MSGPKDDEYPEDENEISCWWIFFHKWSMWVDTLGGIIQRRRCDKCGKSQERFV